MTSKSDSKRFNPKVYQKKLRIWRKIPATVHLFRVLEWDPRYCEYRNPPRGLQYLARRREVVDGRRKLASMMFETLEESRAWQARDPRMGTAAHQNQSLAARVEMRVPAQPAVEGAKGPLFGEVVEEWKRRVYPRLAVGTRNNYERYLRLHFQEVMSVAIRDITPRFIDCWLDSRKEGVGLRFQSRKRTNFDHELSVMRVILKYYADYYEDTEFRFPLKARHTEASQVGRANSGSGKQKDLTSDEFLRFRDELLKGPSPEVMAALATVQYFQALRVSEVAALHWEDVVLDWKQPENSRVRITRHVIFLRGSRKESFIEQGFKNASKDEPIKEQPMFPMTFEALKTLFHIGARGLIFRSPRGSFFIYREIQHAYDHAFARAGLPYSGTHVLRHGGTRNVYNETGDLAVAQQLLGNADLETTLVYAKRQKTALTKVAATHWERSRLTAKT